MLPIKWMIKKDDRKRPVSAIQYFLAKEDPKSPRVAAMVSRVGLSLSKSK